MQPIHQAVQVTFRYPIHFTQGVFARDNLLLKDILCAEETDTPKKVLCVVDRGVARCHPGLLSSIEAYCRYHSEFLTLAGPPLIVEGGEVVKNDPSHVTSIHRAINAFGIDRHSYVIAIGGGGVIDAVGYAAATAHRGVRLVRVPTTVLSQNDSAVGVKNSINAFGKKNFLGTFTPPHAVLNDLDFLTTLSNRDWRSGISEAIKVALLKDVAFFEFIEEHADDLARRDTRAMQWLIYRCAQLHLEHIATTGDPFEFGSSRPLDFGHWAAHKLEQLSNYGLRHGEAVAVGLALDSTYSYLVGLLPERDWRRILRLISSLRLAVHAPELDLRSHDGADEPRIFGGLNEFREHLGGQLTVMLLRSIGEGLEVHKVEERVFVESIALLKEYQASRAHGGQYERTLWYLPAYSAAAG
jgi:3-dehydroquinate synthase